jgi:hypothetical protein
LGVIAQSPSDFHNRAYQCPVGHRHIPPQGFDQLILFDEPPLPLHKVEKRIKRFRFDRDCSLTASELVRIDIENKISKSIHRHPEHPQEIVEGSQLNRSFLATIIALLNTVKNQPWRRRSITGVWNPYGGRLSHFLGGIR